MAENKDQMVPETEGMEDNIIELTDENGESTQFEYLATVEYENKLYVALGVLEGAASDDDSDEDEEESEVVILEIQKDENGEDMYVSVESDEVGEAVFNKFLSMLEEEDEE